MLYSFQMYNIVMQQSPTLLNGHPNECSYYLSIQRDIYILLTIVPLLYFHPQDSFTL